MKCNVRVVFTVNYSSNYYYSGRETESSSIKKPQQRLENVMTSIVDENVGM